MLKILGFSNRPTSTNVIFSLTMLRVSLDCLSIYFLTMANIPTEIKFKAMEGFALFFILAPIIIISIYKKYLNAIRICIIVDMIAILGNGFHLIRLVIGVIMLVATFRLSSKEFFKKQYQPLT